MIPLSNNLQSSWKTEPAVQRRSSLPTQLEDDSIAEGINERLHEGSNKLWLHNQLSRASGNNVTGLFGFHLPLERLRLGLKPNIVSAWICCSSTPLIRSHTPHCWTMKKWSWASSWRPIGISTPPQFLQHVGLLLVLVLGLIVWDA